jgi:hypothetical protein
MKTREYETNDGERTFFMLQSLLSRGAPKQKSILCVAADHSYGRKSLLTSVILHVDGPKNQPIVPIRRVLHLGFVGGALCQDRIPGQGKLCRDSNLPQPSYLQWVDWNLLCVVDLCSLLLVHNEGRKK